MRAFLIGSVWAGALTAVAETAYFFARSAIDARFAPADQKRAGFRAFGGFDWILRQ